MASNSSRIFEFGSIEGKVIYYKIDEGTKSQKLKINQKLREQKMP